ncbi:hypothetical protein ES332_A02G041200v1 [Gossypium tomentosum]|uniref:40S ribosomal protein S3a n=1 Tax=Gossypium tomentosum TaxID=34277 RepID=A0A5D2RCU2_GOSTO|nr:hypothetical protein ES332_A02G041200v1 [Gossypium tomentosum]
MLCPIQPDQTDTPKDEGDNDCSGNIVRFEGIGSRKEIEKATSSIYPLQNVFIREVKILKAPKFDLGKLMAVHGDYSEDVRVKIGRPADETMAEPTPELIGA